VIDWNGAMAFSCLTSLKEPQCQRDKRSSTMSSESVSNSLNPLITISVQIPSDKAWAVAHFIKNVPWETIEGVGSGMGSERYQEALRVSDGLKVLSECFEAAGFVSSPTKHYSGTSSTFGTE
jgi:hypothetical protein